MNNSQNEENEVKKHSDIQLPNNWKYEETVAQVEAMITKIESGKMELAEVFDTFTTALEYLRICDMFLAERRQQINLFVENIAEECDNF